MRTAQMFEVALIGVIAADLTQEMPACLGEMHKEMPTGQPKRLGFAVSSELRDCRFEIERAGAVHCRVRLARAAYFAGTRSQAMGRDRFNRHTFGLSV